MKSGADTLPPLKLWRERFAEKYAPLTHARFAVENVASEFAIPAENLISPEIIRRICWAPPADSLQNLNTEAVATAMLGLGARQWQVDVVAPLVANALLEREPREIPAEEAPETVPETP
jgi:ribonuclease D